MYLASNLRRAQFSAIAAWESLINYATKADMSCIATNLKSAATKFYVNAGLQEITMGIPTWTKFKKGYLENDCKKYFDEYLNEGFFKSGHRMKGLWHEMFTEEMQQILCSKLEYESTSDNFAKWLNNQIQEDEELIIIGGHSKWFQYFVDKYAKSKTLKDLWGKKAKNVISNKYTDNHGKIKNGYIVDVVVEASGDLIEIDSIKGIFKNEKKKPSFAKKKGHAKDDFVDLESKFNEEQSKSKSLEYSGTMIGIIVAMVVIIGLLLVFVFCILPRCKE